MSKKVIGIFRALDVRLSHAEFTGSFRQFQPRFFANLNPQIEDYLINSGISYTDLPLRPRYYFDPVKPIFKKDDFSPWVEFETDRLEAAIGDVDIFEVYEPYFFYSAQIARLAKKKNRPVVTEIWTSFPQHPATFFQPYRSLVQEVMKKTDLFILRSEKALTFLEKYPVENSKKVMIYHGVNIKRFYPAKKTKQKTLRILFVGSLAPHKGLDDLLDVFPQLVGKHPVELIICGQGPLKTRVLRMSKNLPIRYCGQVFNLKLPEVYRQADIFCGPSKDYFFFGLKAMEEFAGYVFMEALASGLPIVSTQCGGIPEITGNDNILIEQGNKLQLFDALQKYITNPGLRQETGIKNRKRAEIFFDLEKQVQEMENVLKKKVL